MIRIEHLVKNYGATCAVDDISFSVEEGEIVGFLGPNGAGKSTTMNILTGYLSSTSGKACIAGIDILRDPIGAKKLIGYLPEQPPLYLDMTVEEYLNFAYDLKGCKLDRKEHLASICDTVKIKEMYHKVIRTLSKGYRQRVGIAQALVGNPRVIIFDEPTVGLDPKQIIEIRNLIRSLGKNHTVILSTHILQEVQAVCDRIVIINKGKIVANEKTENISRVMVANRRFNVKIVGPQKDVLSMLRAIPGMTYAEALAERDGDAFVYMIESEAGVDIRKKLFYQLAERSWPLIGMEALGMSLEDIFISVVDKSEEKKVTRLSPKERRKVRTSVSAEHEIGASLYEDAQRQRSEAANSLSDEDDD
ncbi:MAG: ATP-binding cassette domain-containing protein [Clostridia bacterium]|nr:ATP-binding cassette domain-containing protein [Clostridia bacterium]